MTGAEYTSQHEAADGDLLLATEVAASPPDRSRLSATVVTLAVVSLVLVLVDILLVVAAWYLFASWPNPGLALLGVVALLLAIELRPRLHRWDDDGATELSPQQAPELWALVERVAGAVGAPRPDRLLVDGEFNAASGRSGVRRRATLSIGLPLWAALDPQERVALLGHELGHLVNGDPRRGVVTGLAQTTFGRLAWIFDPAHNDLPPIVAVVFAAVHFPCAGLHRAVARAGARDGHRAEYLADAVAVRTGGTAASLGVLATLLLGSPVTTDVERVARRGEGLAEWRAAAAAARERHASELVRRAEWSCREQASVTASHPPAGWRWWVVSQWPWQEGTYRSTPADAVDHELERVARAIGRQLDLT